MLANQQFAPGTFRLLTENIIDICESPSGTGKQNDQHRPESVPEKKPLYLIDGYRQCRILKPEVVQKVDGYHCRNPIARGKVMDKAVDNHCNFLRVHAGKPFALSNNPNNTTMSTNAGQLQTI